MVQTAQDGRVQLLLNRIARAQVIIGVSVDELRMLFAWLPDAVRNDRSTNFLGSMTGAYETALRSPIVDMNAMTITWNGHTCHVRQVVLLRLFDRLSQRSDHYITIERLLRDVWDGQVRTDDTVRSTVRHLKQRLTRAEMNDLAVAIKASGRRYGLMLRHS